MRRHAPAWKRRPGVKRHPRPFQRQPRGALGPGWANSDFSQVKASIGRSPPATGKIPGLLPALAEALPGIGAVDPPSGGASPCSQAQAGTGGGAHRFWLR